MRSTSRKKNVYSQILILNFNEFNLDCLEWVQLQAPVEQNCGFDLGFSGKFANTVMLVSLKTIQNKQTNEQKLN